MAFMRAYQRLSGDPFLASTSLVSKRKQAGSGPRMKAFRKRSVRQLRLVKQQAMGDPFLGLAPVAVRAAGQAALGGSFKGAGEALKGMFGKLAGAAKAALPGVGALLQGGIPALANMKPMSGTSSSLPFLPGLPGMGSVPGSLSPGALRSLGGGGKRRTMNVANVKALRRGIRRLEGFKSLVARVDKMLPTAARTGVRPSRKRKRR